MRNRGIGASAGGLESLELLFSAMPETKIDTLDQAAEAARRREQFLAMLSHELRNPLAVILDATRTLQSQPVLEVAQRCRELIECESKRMTRLLDDLLDAWRITSGAIQRRDAPFDSPTR